MLVKRKLKDLSEYTSLKTVETYSFQKSSLQEFKKNFDFLKGHGFIHSDSFDDPVWLFPCDNKDRDIIFRFDIEIYKELNLALKGYILVKRMAGRAISSCHTIHRQLKKAIMASEGLELIEKLESFLLRQTPQVAYETARIINQFLLFYEHKKNSEIVEVCNSIPKPERHNRELPNFLDVMTFDEQLTHFMDTATDEVKIRFYPVYIWWKLTNIIPMRVIEFVKLRKNCIERREDNTFWIKLRREKKEADSPFKIDVSDTVQINQEMYQIIKKYAEIIDEMGIETPFLLPYDLYVRFLQMPIHSSWQRKGKQNRLIDKYLQRIIDDFYNEVIKDSKMDKVRCGDTRHFAIINMFLQGFNMLSIARIAGHEDLQTQSNYYSHVDHFIQSQVYLLAQKKLEDSTGKAFSDGILGKRREAFDRGRMYNHRDLVHFRKVDYGYCMDEGPEFPSNCIEDCRVCPNFIFKPPVNEYQEGIKWLEDYFKTLDQNIKETVEYMLCVSKSMYYDFQNLSHQKTGQGKLDSASSQLLKMMDHMAVVQSRLMEFNYEN